MTQLAPGSDDTAHKKRSISLFDSAIGDSFKKLNPRLLFRHPVMFEVVAALTGAAA